MLLSRRELWSTFLLERREIDQCRRGKSGAMLCLRNSREKRHSLLCFLWYPFLPGHPGRTREEKNTEKLGDANRSIERRLTRLFSRTMNASPVAITRSGQKFFASQREK